MMKKHGDVLVHASAHASFGVGGPVFAVEADEDRRVRNGHGGFEDKDVELFAGLIDLSDDAFMRNGFDGVAREHLRDLRAVS